MPTIFRCYCCHTYIHSSVTAAVVASAPSAAIAVGLKGKNRLSKKNNNNKSIKHKELSKSP